MGLPGEQGFQWVQCEHVGAGVSSVPLTEGRVCFWEERGKGMQGCGTGTVSWCKAPFAQRSVQRVGPTGICRKNTSAAVFQPKAQCKALCHRQQGTARGNTVPRVNRWLSSGEFSFPLGGNGGSVWVVPVRVGFRECYSLPLVWGETLLRCACGFTP